MSGPQPLGDSAIRPRLAKLLESRWAIRCGDLQPVAGGDESLAWRASTDGRPLLLHLSPPWRRIEELRWVHRVIARLAAHIPAIAPLAAKDGSTVAPVGGRLLSVYPFIEGVHLDREDPIQRRSAARLLAALHRAQASLTFDARPLVGAAPPNLPHPQGPAELADAELDRWHAAITTSELPRGLIHGDFYRRNLLWANERVVGVVDWHEAHHDLIAREVAWAIWEFAKGDGGRALLTERAREFLAAYQDAGRSLSDVELDALVPFIRWRLRDEVRRARAAATRGEPWDEDYARAETSAFGALRGPAARWR